MIRFRSNAVLWQVEESDPATYLNTHCRVVATINRNLAPPIGNDRLLRKGESLVFLKNLPTDYILVKVTAIDGHTAPNEGACIMIPRQQLMNMKDEWKAARNRKKDNEEAEARIKKAETEAVGWLREEYND